MRKKKFFLILLLITLLGFALRLVDYAKVPPPDEAFDEVHYAWGGATLIKDGTPKSWSNFNSYKNIEYIERYGIKWRIVSPLIEKPPLYFLLSGLTVTLSGTNNVFDISHKVIRILPLLLSIPTVFLVGILARQIFSTRIALFAALLFAINPMIILANRMSVTENLLTPLSLAALIILIKPSVSKKFKNAIILGIISCLTILTKQIGAVVAIVSAIIFYRRGQFKNMLTILSFATLGFLTYFLIGLYFDWQLFWSLQQDVRIGHTLSGLPESIATIFRFPTIGPKNHPFLDGTILLGFILLFSSVIWIKEKRYQIFLAFPFIYLALLALGQSGAGAFTFFGWYLFPLYPFLIILLAKFLNDFFKKPSVLTALLLVMIIGSSTVRFIFLMLPKNYHHLWQYLLITALFIFLWSLILKKRHSRIVFLTFFVFYIAVNILVAINLTQIYTITSLKDESLKGFIR